MRLGNENLYRENNSISYVKMRSWDAVCLHDKQAPMFSRSVSCEDLSGTLNSNEHIQTQGSVSYSVFNDRNQAL